VIPTSQSYDAMTRAYHFFNERLFEGQLPDVLISCQRKANCAGYASSNRWIDNNKVMVHELAMNPAYFAGSPTEEVLGTLLHESVHILQFHVGKPGRGRYHNKEWAGMMTKIGLIPSHDGLPDGKQTGDSMRDYFLWGGPAWQAVRELIDEHGFAIP
jgi:hypothetical protein